MRPPAGAPPTPARSRAHRRRNLDAGQGDAAADASRTPRRILTFTRCGRGHRPSMPPPLRAQRPTGQPQPAPPAVPAATRLAPSRGQPPQVILATAAKGSRGSCWQARCCAPAPCGWIIDFKIARKRLLRDLHAAHLLMRFLPLSASRGACACGKCRAVALGGHVFAEGAHVSRADDLAADGCLMATRIAARHESLSFPASRARELRALAVHDDGEGVEGLAVTRVDLTSCRRCTMSCSPWRRSRGRCLQLVVESKRTGRRAARR